MSPEDLAFLDALLRARCGLRLRPDKGYFAEGRLALARREGLESAPALIRQLRERPDGPLAVYAAEALSVTETAFFRDGAVFDAIGAAILPALAGLDRPARAWCAGCSTGQEAYSLAMLAALRAPPLGLEIVATDLSARVLEKAQSGLYTQFEVQRGLPIRLLLEHFEKAGELWAISPRLRAAVRWRRLNLIEPRRSVRPFDLILCRYVLGYFEPEMRDRVAAQLVAALAPGGYLVLGPEDDAPRGFVTVGAAGVYRAAPDAARAAA